MYKVSCFLLAVLAVVMLVGIARDTVTYDFSRVRVFVSNHNVVHVIVDNESVWMF